MFGRVVRVGFPEGFARSAVHADALGLNSELEGSGGAVSSIDRLFSASVRSPFSCLIRYAGRDGALSAAPEVARFATSRSVK